MTFHCYLGFYSASTLEMPFAVTTGFMAAMGPHISSPERIPGTRAIERPECLFRGLLSVLGVHWLPATPGLCTSIALLQGCSLDLHRAAAPQHPSTTHTHTYITASHRPLFSSASFVLLVLVLVGLTKINLPCVFFAEVLSISLPCRMWILSRLEPWPSPFQPCTHNNAQHLMILV